MEELKILLKTAKGQLNFDTIVDNINGKEFKIKYANGKSKQYLMKSGKSKTGFFCPFCPFGSDRAQNLKLHIKKCQSITEGLKPVNKKTLERIPLCDIVHDINDLEEELDSLVMSMREITDPKMSGTDREKYIGAMCWKFRNNFLPTSMFKNKDWNNQVLKGKAKEMGFYYDPDFRFAILEKPAKFTMLGINEIIPYLIANFKPIFEKGYSLLKKDDFAPPAWWWHKAIYGVAHPNDWQIIDVDQPDDLHQLPEHGSSQWQHDMIQQINKSKPVYVN
tara:strand:+ start:436 stop:1266 length:831 start_codon:yes stop_codon:yes gene_type:complete